MAITIETTVCAESANSYADLTGAGEYFTGDPDFHSVWSDLDDEERSRLLIAATRCIDRARWKDQPLTVLFQPTLGLDQALAFPRQGQEYRFGKADSGSLTGLVDGTLAGRAFWPDDCFGGGSVFAVSGDNKGLIRSVEGFDSATGTLTLAAFPQALTGGDQYLLIWPLERKIVSACLEQAAHLHLAGASGLAAMSASGLNTASIDGLSLTLEKGTGAELCHRARTMLADYRLSGPRLGRG